MANKPNKLDALYSLLAHADDTYNSLPLSMRLEVEKISQGLSEFGPRKLSRRGMGTEFFESRDFRPDVDEYRRINARLSARAGKDVVVEKEAEIRQHFYLWRDASGSMEFASQGQGHTKKQASEIMLLAMSKHLAKNEELIGVLDGKGMYRGGKASQQLAEQLNQVTIMTGGMPALTRKLPRNSTAILFSDFMMDPQDLAKGLGQMTGIGLNGYLVMVLDPQEVLFDYKGHVEFSGLEGEGSIKFKKADSLKAAYQKALRAQIDAVQNICKAKGFSFILQRTDQPLHKALLGIYGLTPGAAEHSLVRDPGSKPEI